MSTSFPKPVEYTVDIIGIGMSGDGIARVQGFVIFVRNARPGARLLTLSNKISIL